MIGILDDDSKKRPNHNYVGGCLTSLVLLMVVPLMIAIGAVTYLL